MTPKQITKAASHSWIEVPYASWPVFNHDNSLLILIHQNHYELYDGSGKWLQSLPLSADCDPRWTRRSPFYQLFYISGNQVRLFDMKTGLSTILRTFTESGHIRLDRGESDLSEDGAHLVLSDDKNRIWTYDVYADKVTDSKIWPRDFNALYITPNNQTLVCEDGGVFVLQGGRQIAPSLAHNDVCRGLDGREYFIRFNSGDRQPIPNCANGIERVDIETGERVCLWSLDWTFAGHISCPDQKGWSGVSIYSPSNKTTSGVYRLMHDGSGAQLLCDTGSVMMRDPNTGGMAYNPTPRASFSRDGTRCVFNSNSGILDRGVNYVDVFLVEFGNGENMPDPNPAPPPIVVQPQPAPVTPSPDLNAELDKQREQLRNLQAFLGTREEYIRTLEQQVYTLTNSLTDMMKALAATKAPHVDAEVWHEVDFLNPSQIGRKWEYEVLPNGTLDMRDVYGEDRPSVKDADGNQYLFLRVPGGYEMYERRTNKK